MKLTRSRGGNFHIHTSSADTTIMAFFERGTERLIVYTSAGIYHKRLSFDIKNGNLYHALELACEAFEISIEKLDKVWRTP